MANASTPAVLSVNLARSAPPALPDGIDQARSAAWLSASVAVSVATAVWFSAAEKLDALVMTGAAGAPPPTVTDTVSSSDRLPASVTVRENTKVADSITEAGAVKLAAAVLAPASVTSSPPVCIQA